MKERTYLDHDGLEVYVHPVKDVWDNTKWGIYRKRKSGFPERIKSKYLGLFYRQSIAQKKLDHFAKAKGWKEKDLS